MLLSLQRGDRRSTSTHYRARRRELPRARSTASTTCTAPATSPSSSWSRSTSATPGCSSAEPVARAARARRARRAASDAPRARATCSQFAARRPARRARPGPRPRRSARLEAALEVEVGGERDPLPPGRRSSRPTRPTPSAGRRSSGARRRCSPSSSTRSCARRWSARTRPAASSAGAATPTPTPTCAGSTSRALAGADRAFLGATDGRLRRGARAPAGARPALPPLGELRRSDLPRFFRAPELDAGFAAERLVAVVRRDAGGAGGRPRARSRTSTSTPRRAPTKSPRAFCSPLRVPDEVYLVIAPVGGRDDFGALLHEGGHTEHYANADAELAVRVPPPRRQLGHRVVRVPVRAPDRGPGLARATCSAIDDAGAVRRARPRLAAGPAAPLRGEARLRAASCTAARPTSTRCRSATPSCSAARPGSRWPQRAWLADVDPGFYVACYLRAWALETHWRRALRERFGERWFAEPEAGRVAARALAPRPAAAAPTSCSPRAGRGARLRRRWSPSWPPPRLAGRLPAPAASRSRRGCSCAPCRASPGCGPCAARPWLQVARAASSPAPR